MNDTQLLALMAAILMVPTGEAVYSRSEAIIEAQQLLQETRDREAATEARARGQQPQGEEE